MLSRSIFLGAIALAGCGGKGSYELHWTIGCASATSAACQVASARDCSRAGLDALEVVERRGSEGPTRTQLACWSAGEGAVGRGPGLDEGALRLEVFGLTPGGQRLTGPVTLDVIIPATGLVRAEVDLPRPAACHDGVDNDGDGLIDLHDVDCKDATDTSEER
jgi:hypothetical protein